MPIQIVAANHVSQSFGGVQALRDVSLALYGGEVRCLVGENGSGKSTLIKIMAGALRPDSGTITLGGQRFTHLEPIQAIREGIQVIYQDFSLFPNLTVAENLALNTELEQGVRLVNWRTVRRIAAEAMEKLGRDIGLDKTVSELSVADKQLVAIAKALLQNARVLIMDEPTTALTHKEVRTLFEIVRELKHRGLAILFVGHKLQEVLEISDTITVLRNGQKVAEERRSRDLRHSDLVRHMTGRQLPDRPSEGVSEQWHRHPADGSSAGSRCHNADTVLKVTDLTRRDAFEHISFEVRAGEILGVTGLLGSGRTELARSLFGLEPADSGRIEIGGQTVRMRTVQDAIRAGIAYVPEDRLTEGVFAEQSIERNIAISGLSSLAGRLGWIKPASLRRVVGQWMTELRIQAPSARMPVASLSGGNQQKVVLGRWLATQAKILILNGPTVGIDIGAKSEVHEKIRELARKGMAVLLISDDLPELAEVCHRILVMHRGRNRQGTPRDRLQRGHVGRRVGQIGIDRYAKTAAKTGILAGPAHAGAGRRHRTGQSRLLEPRQPLRSVPEQHGDGTVRPGRPDRPGLRRDRCVLRRHRRLQHVRHEQGSPRRGLPRLGRDCVLAGRRNRRIAGPVQRPLHRLLSPAHADRDAGFGEPLSRLSAGVCRHDDCQ